MIRIENLTCGYDGSPVVWEVTARFPSRQITALVGPNGCGKSTLLKTACGILGRISGQVYLDDAPLDSLSPNARAKRVSFLPQSRDLGQITARNLVSHGRFPYLSYPRRYSKTDLEYIHKAMEQTGVLSMADKRLGELSGGERQRVYLAMLLAQDTDTVFLDEPTTYLDVNHQYEILDIITGMKSMGKTVVLVLHDLNHALRFSDRVGVMDKGTLLALDAPEKIYESRILEKVFGIASARCDADGRTEYLFYKK